MTSLDEKNILVIISSPPFRNLNGYEALRASIALIDHMVKIVWTQDGVYSALQATKNKMAQPIMRLADDLDIELYVYEKDLQKRNLQGQELVENIQTMSHEDFLEELVTSDIIMTF